MLLDVKIKDGSVSIQIDEPFRADLDGIIKQISQFAASKDADISGLDIAGLIPKMIKGIAGCEHGCPSNAKDVVRRGVKGFELDYIEGGILSAKATGPLTGNLTLKMFPDF